MNNRLWNQAFEDECCDDCDDELPYRRPRWIRERSEYFDDLDDTDFATRFRLSKRSALDVLQLIEDELEFRTDKNFAVSPVNQLLLALRYYATGSSQLAVGDFSGVSKTTAHRIIHRVSRAIASLHSDYIKFPTSEEEIRQKQVAFYNIANFPRVVGALDCTHIKIKSPGNDTAEVFRNRKGYFSLNTQVICDSNLLITDILCRWPGSAHDQHIFNSCNQPAMFETGKYGNSVLVVDSAYGYRPYMMAPLESPSTRVEHLYNEAQIRTRNVVERLFGVWKRRFPVLALGVNVKLKNIFPIVIATSVLHNILRKNKEDLPPDDPSLHLPLPWNAIIALGNIEQIENNNPPRRVVRDVARRQLIEQYFGNLLSLSEDNNCTA